MVKELFINGYDAFVEFMANLQSEDRVNIYFSGTKGDDGISWCPDCVVAEPYVRDSLKFSPENSTFIYVDVGDRASWKSASCPFRTDRSTRLNVIPTIIRWKSPQRLEGDQCANVGLLEMFFTDED